MAMTRRIGYDGALGTDRSPSRFLETSSSAACRAPHRQAAVRKVLVEPEAGTIPAQHVVCQATSLRNDPVHRKLHPLMQTYRVGQDISTQCGKCKQRTWHVIFALEGSIVKRVQCKQCQSYHNYKADPDDRPVQETKTGSPGVLRRRDGQPVAAPVSEESALAHADALAVEAAKPMRTKAPAAPKPPGAPRTPRAKAAPAAPDYESQWTEALRGKDLDSMVRYRPDGEYSDQAVLDHPTFGVGYVQKVSPMPERKMVVLFKDGPRTLAIRLGK